MGCMARWKAEYFDRGAGFGGNAANVGTSVHYALEHFVRDTVMEKTMPWDDIKHLEVLYMKGFMETFGHGDFRSAEFKDGWDLCKKWHKRTSFEDVFKVVSVEQKLPFDVPVIINGEKSKLQMNYIMDRMDQIDEAATEIRVVDYKTVRVPIDPEELFEKPQARIYALMAQVKYPNATTIRVMFDLIRHDPVGVIYSREDNIENWEWLKREAQRIVDTPEANPPETLNADCRYCIRKSECGTLKRNVNVGGILGKSLEELARIKLDTEYKLKGLEALVSECDTALLREAAQRNELEFSLGGVDVDVKASRRRKILNPTRVAEILGPNLMAQNGSIGVTALDGILKSDALTDEEKKEVTSLIAWQPGDLKAKVKESSHA